MRFYYAFMARWQNSNYWRKQTRKEISDTLDLIHNAARNGNNCIIRKNLSSYTIDKLKSYGYHIASKVGSDNSHFYKIRWSKEIT